MVEGVQVSLPSYEEAVSGAGSTALPRLLPQAQLESMENMLTQTSATHTQHTDISVVHQPSSSSSFSSSWSLDGAQGAAAASSTFQCPNSDSSQQNSVLSLHGSEQDLADGTKSLCYYYLFNLLNHGFSRFPAEVTSMVTLLLTVSLLMLFLSLIGQKRPQLGQ